jgi:hypothetical protein
MNDIEERIRFALAPYRLDEKLVLGEPAAQHASRRLHRRRSRVLIAAAVAVVLTLGLAVILPRGVPGSSDPAVAALLHRFARIAQHAPAEPTPQQGQYVYTKTLANESYAYVSGDGRYRFVYSVPVTTQQWLGLDSSGLQVNSTGDHPTFPTEQDRSTYQAYLASGGDEVDKMQFDLGKTTRDRYGPNGLFWRDTSTLPTDSEELGRLIEDRQIVGGPKGDWESFALATDLIRDSYARPDLRAALYTYMTGLSGIELVGNTTDEIGRPGVALASSHDGMRYEVVFDRATGKILEERDIVLDANDDVFHNPGPGEFAYAYPGGSAYKGTYERSAEVVDSIGQIPSG